MANTATSILVDTLSGTSAKQTGHPEFELSEAIGFSPFTIELWYQHSYTGWTDWTTFMSITNTTAGADNTTASTAGSDFYLMGQYGSGQNYYASSIYDTDGSSGGTIDTNDFNGGEIIRNTNWHHLAMTREFQGFAGIWHDGVLIGGDNNAYADRTIAGKRVELGFNRFDAGNYMFTGYMDEVRISKVARYGNFKTPTAPLSSSQTAGPGVNALKPENVVFLLQANNTTTTSDTIVEQTGRGTITVNGTLPYSITESLPWANTSFGPFTTSNYLTYENFDADKFNLTGKDFSYETWLYQTAHGEAGKYAIIMMLSDSGSPYYMYWSCHNSNNVSNHLYFNDGTNDTTISEVSRGAAVPLNQWTHIAICRNSGTLSYHVNGQLHQCRIDSSPVTSIRAGMSHLRIGAGYNTSDFYNFPGYMDGIRICMGVAAYTPHFTPYGGQKNIVHNRGGAVTDARLASANTHAIQTGRAAIGSDPATSGNNYSLDFDGTDDYLVHKTAGGTGTTQFRSDDDRGTIFAWIYPDVVNSHGGIFSAGYTGDTHTYFDFYLSSGAKLGMQQRENDTGDGVTGDTSLTASTWQSVAVVSDGTAWALYVNGTAQSLTVGSGTNAGEWFADTPNLNNITIGTLLRTSAVDKFNGKIMQVAYFGGSVGTNGVLTAAQISALHSAGKSHDLTTATGVYTASEIDDLKGYWRMGNHYLDAPETIYDASGNGYDMQAVHAPVTQTLSGTLYYQGWQHRGYFTPDKYTSLLIQSSNHEGSTGMYDTGPGFKKIEFNGTDANLSTGAAYRNSDMSGSIATWIKWGGLSSGTSDTLFGGFTSNGNYYMYLAVLASTLYWDFNVDNDATRVAGPIATGINQGEWSHIVVTQTGDPDDPAPLKFYVNGSEATYNPSDHNKRDHHELWFGNHDPTNFTIGSWHTTGASTTDWTKTQMSQFAVWGGTTANATGAVLSASDVSALYALGPNGNVKTDYSTGLVDYWTMGNLTGEGDDLVTSGTTVYSQVTGGQDLTKGGTISAPFVGHTLTRHTQVTHKTDKSVFGGSSLYFPASPAAKCLTVASSIDWALGPKDWTMELWINPYDVSGNECYLAHGTSSGPHTRWYFIQTGDDLYFDYYVSGSVVVRIQSGDVLKAQQWQHVALVHDSTGGPNGDEDYLLYHDGILVKTLDDDTDLGSTTGDLHIGTNTASSGAEDPYKGHMDEIRISSGVARYSKSIERFANTFVAKGDTGDAFTAFQIDVKDSKHGDSVGPYNFSGTAAAGAFLHDVIIWSNRKANPYGGTTPVIAPQMESAAGEAWIQVPDNGVFNALGTEDWTYEFWWAHNKSVLNSGRIWFIAGYDDYMIGLAHNHNQSSGKLEMWASTNGTSWDIMGESPGLGYQHSSEIFHTDNAWRHIVWQRKDKNFELYIDGVLDFSIYSASSITTDSGGGAIFLSHANETYAAQGDFFDGLRFSYKIARYGEYQLRTTQQTHVSANANIGVITSNSTFGSANNIFSTDGHTALLLNGDELYSNTHVAASGNTFLSSVGNTNVSNVTTTYAVTVASGQKLDGTTGNIYYINGYGRPALTLVRDNHYIFDISDTNYGNHPFRLATGANGPNYTTGVVVDTSGTTTQIKFSPTSSSPDSLHYYCGSHNNMGFTASVVDSTGSDGVIAPTPVGVRKADGTTTANFPIQTQGFSAYGANSYFLEGTNDYLTIDAPTSGNFHFDTGDFTIELWMYPTGQPERHSPLIQKGHVTNANEYDWRLYWGDSDYKDPVWFDYYYGGTSMYVTQSGVSNDVQTIDINIWYHVVAQKSGEETCVYVNGIKTAVGTVASGLVIDDDYNGTSAIHIGRSNLGSAGDAHFKGHLDSIRISKGIARYGTTKTNTKLGTNVVHHSHQKLLITSNTFHGNTHFDDFADQGNYWNQQPSSYFFDGSDDYIDVGGFPQTGTVYSVYAVWFKATEDATGSESLIGSRGGGTDNGYWLYVSQSDGKLGSSSEGSGYSEGWNWVYSTQQHFAWGAWHLGVMVHDGTTSVKIYGDGILEATQSTVGGTMAGGAYTSGYRIGDQDGSSYNFHGQIAQVGAWKYDSSSALTTKWTDSAHQALWELGPTGNWMTDYSDNLLSYFTMGNHNDLGGRPADTASTVYDRSGNGNDGTTAGSMNAPAKGLGGAITNQGSVKHSTDIKNFGSSALYFPGANPDYLTMPDKTLPYFNDADWTIEAWIWFNKTSSGTLISKTASSTYGQIRIDISDVGLITCYMTYDNATGANVYMNNLGSEITHRNWHHLVVQRRRHVHGEMYIDGALVGEKEMTVDPLWDNTDQWEIGRLDGTNHYVYQGYMDELGIIVGTAKYTPVVTGVGTATITPSVLPDPTGNHFTTSGLAITDQMLDSPENNFCTLNSAGYNLVAPIEGNLKVATTMNKGIFGTMAFTKGKWYHEVKAVDAYGATHARHGFFQYTGKEQYQVAQGAGAFGDYGATVNYIGADGYILGIDTDATHVNHAVTHADAIGDIFMYALDLDDPDGKCWFGVNGTWFAGNPAKGIDPPSNSSRLKDPHGTLGFPGAPWTWGHFVTDNLTSTQHANFGQGDPDGENNYADSNGRGGFRYEPPSGFLSWCTANMKDADFAPIGPNSAAGTPDKHFDTLLWEGNSDVGPRNIGGLNFRPDLVWTKTRDATYSHELHDSIRGSDKVIYPDLTAAEDNAAANVDYLDFNDNGIDVGFHSSWKGKNETGKDYVAWCWKAGNKTTENSDGTITVTTSVNQDAGFSIIKGTAKNVQANDMSETFGHGLTEAPDIIIQKNLDAAVDWMVFHPPVTNSNLKGLKLNDTAAMFTNGSYKTFEITDTLIKHGRQGVETNGNRFIVYAWHSVEGYSKFGTYEGNGNADGPFVYTGFKPAWLLIKNVDQGSRNWQLLDSKRNPTNPANDFIRPNATTVETSNYDVDFVANGFKLRNTDADYNESGQTFIYMAFAEMPFKYANAR